jgi:hypothetical protein
MRTLNSANVEELVFYDQKVHLLIPDLGPLIQQWQLTQRVPGFNYLRRKSVLDLLNSLTEQHLAVLEQYFGEPVRVERLDYLVVKNMEGPLDMDLSDVEGFKHLVVSRDEDRLYLSLWK